MGKRSDGCSDPGQWLDMSAPCVKKNRPQRNMTIDYYWTGAQENIGMFSKS